MFLLNLRRAASCAFLTVACAWSAHGQCLDWRAFPLEGITGQALIDAALVVHDDGTGPALYVGQVTEVGQPTQFEGIRRWDGQEFTSVGTGLEGNVHALAVFDDGTGPALYAAGTFTIPGSSSRHIARWDGSTWSGLGSGIGGDLGLRGMTVHDDGSGPALYVGGMFETAGGIPARHVARWDGTSWSALGAGITSGYVANVLTSFDDGTGPALYVGGFFGPLPGTSSFHVARWSHGTWSGVGSGVGTGGYGEVLTLVGFDDGSGPALYAGGLFFVPTRGLARWDGATWSAVGSGPISNTFVSALRVADVGQGPRLYAGTYSLPPHGLFSWDGSSWTPLLSPSQSACANTTSMVRSIAVFDEGSGPHVFAGTTPGVLGIVSRSLSRWSGSAWEPVGPAPRGLQGANVRALHVHDDGSGSALYAGGEFCGADADTAACVARWDGAGWRRIGDFQPYPVHAFETYDPGTGPKLYAGGRSARLQEWNGVSWVTSAASFQGEAIDALQAFGSDLYVGGRFTAFHGTNSPNLIRWNGSTFSPVGSGSSAGVNGAVYALERFDAGSGPALYVGGTFTSGNGASLLRVARWDGTSFSPLGAGMNGVVHALVVHDDGSGPALYAAGAFTTAGGGPASNVARWNPATSTWSALGAGLNAQVLSLGTFDDGSGAALYAGGNFSASGGTPIQRIAKWNGVAWSAVGAGTDAGIWALRSHDDGTGIGSQLFAGGEFHQAGALPSNLVAAWRGCDGPIARFCFGNGSVAACPCGNQGLAGRGCDNSFGNGGARMNATGTTLPDTIEIGVGGELPNAATLVFQGSALLTGPVPFGDGLRCTGGNVLRLYTLNAYQGSLTVPPPGQPSISARSAALGDPLSIGTVRAYQAWYRDANPDFCGAPAGNAWNLSNAVRIEW